MSSDQASPAAVEELRQKLHEMRQDLHEIGRLLKAAAQEKIRETGAAAAARCKESCEESCQRTQEYTHHVEDYIRAQPVKSLLIAGCVGLLVGSIWGRR